MPLGNPDAYDLSLEEEEADLKARDFETDGMMRGRRRGRKLPADTMRRGDRDLRGRSRMDRDVTGVTDGLTNDFDDLP